MRSSHQTAWQVLFSRLLNLPNIQSFSIKTLSGLLLLSLISSMSYMIASDIGRLAASLAKPTETPRRGTPPAAIPNPPAPAPAPDPGPAPDSGSGSGSRNRPAATGGGNGGNNTGPIKPTRTQITIAPPSSPSVTRINIGEVVPGVLGKADFRDANGSRVEFFQFAGRENQSLVVALTNSIDNRPTGSLSLTPYMRIFDPSGNVIGETIVPGQYRIPTGNPLIPIDNQAFLRLPATGDYTVQVFTDPGAEGRFSLAILHDRTSYDIDKLGELTNRSERLRTDNSPLEFVEFRGQKGQTVQIAATSSDFDPYLFLIAPDGKLIAENDDSGGNFNARIAIQLQETGTYIAIVNAYRSDGRGKYRLTIY